MLSLKFCCNRSLVEENISPISFFVIVLPIGIFANKEVKWIKLLPESNEQTKQTKKWARNAGSQQLKLKDRERLHICYIRLGNTKLTP